MIQVLSIGYKCNLLDSELSEYTIRTRVIGLRAFLYYCMEMGYIDKFNIPNIKTTEKIKETYTEEELKILLKKPNLKKCSPKEYITWVIVNYVYSTRKQVKYCYKY